MGVGALGARDPGSVRRGKGLGLKGAGLVGLRKLALLAILFVCSLVYIIPLLQQTSESSGRIDREAWDFIFL